MRPLSVAASLVVALSVPVFANAHFPGWSVVQSAGDYDVGISLNDPAPNEQNAMGILLLRRQPTAMEEEFDSVDVDVTHDGRPFVHSTLTQKTFGHAWMDILFPESGWYELHVKVWRDGENIAETTVRMPIGNVYERQNRRIAVICGVLAFGCVVLYLAARKRK